MTTSRGDEHGAKHRVTPDGRYFAVRGRLWRTSKPTLAPEHRDKLVQERDASGAPEKLAQAGAAVDAAEVVSASVNRSGVEEQRSRLQSQDGAVHAAR